MALPLTGSTSGRKRPCAPQVEFADVRIYIPVYRIILREIPVTLEMLKSTEAAVVSGVALRDVNRVIDEGILPEGLFSVENGRRILPAACTLISFYFASANSLTSEERRSTMETIGSRLRTGGSLKALVKADWTVRHEFLTIDLGPFVKETAERFDQLAAARDMVVSDPEILGGTPVIRGTRVPVHDVAASVAAGIPMRRILDGYPTVSAAQIQLATIYAEAYPLRGRPRISPPLPRGAIIITDERIPGRRKERV